MLSTFKNQPINNMQLLSTHFMNEFYDYDESVKVWSFDKAKNVLLEK